MLCWGGVSPLPRDQGPPSKESDGWAILPQAKEELPNLFKGPGCLERVGENATGPQWGSPQLGGLGPWSTSTLLPEGLDTN